jgi:hypothetical protein
MSDNYIHYRHVGITGGTINGTLKDADGPVNLTGWTSVTIVAKHPDSESTKFSHAVTSVLDQTVSANHGKGHISARRRRRRHRRRIPSLLHRHRSRTAALGISHRRPRQRSGLWHARHLLI